MTGARPSLVRTAGALPVLLLLLGVLTFFFGFFLLFWMAALSVGLAVGSFQGLKPGEPLSRRALRTLGFLLLGPVFVAGIFAPLRLLALGSAHALGGLAGMEPLQRLLYLPFSPLRWADATVGLMAVVFTLYWAIKNRARLLRVRAQIRNLPTSQAAAAAVGLLELKGVARRVEEPERAAVKTKWGDGSPSRPEPDEARECLLYRRHTAKDADRFTKWSRFWLEDRSGRILVDPRGVDFWAGGFFLTVEAQSLLLFRRRKRGPSAGPGVIGVESLREGDRVYVIGAAEPDRDAPPDAVGSERLVVRPTTLYPARGIMSRLMPTLEDEPAEDYKNTFFLYDRDEASALRVLRKEELVLVRTALVWLGLSLGLFWVGLHHPVAARAKAPEVYLQQPRGYAHFRLEDGWIKGFWPFSHSFDGKSTGFGQGVRETPENREAMAELVDRMYPRLVVVESAGGAEREFVSTLEKRGLRCAVVSKQDVRAYAGRQATWGTPLWTFAVELDARLGDSGLPPPRPYPSAGSHGR